MCPACLATVTLIAAGASSTGGIGALALRALRGKGEARDPEGRHAPGLPSPATSYGDDVAAQETKQ